MAVLVGKKDPLGRTRSREQDRGKALAGKSTLNRLELTPVRANATSRYKKITLDRQAAGWHAQAVGAGMSRARFNMPALRLGMPPSHPATQPIHGQQSGRFFHGYCKNYCYLPLYIFCGEHLLCARMRPANIDASAGSIKADVHPWAAAHYCL